MALPFPLEIRPGSPVYEQIVYAVKRAVAQGALRAGDRFPSVRNLSQEVGVNPNTVQKAVSELTAQGVLEVHAGQGCFIRVLEPPGKVDGVKELHGLLETLVVEATSLGLSEADVRRALAAAGQRLTRE
jgi:GntR family transcriptional regulator